MRPRDISLDAFEPLGDEPSRLARIRRALSTATGALLALALLGALGIWLYGLGSRDPGDVPIIRAAVEPAKTRPEDPGGAIAPHQDITSYRVAESRPVQASAVVIAPPPPQPKPEDVAMGALNPDPASRTSEEMAGPATREVLHIGSPADGGDTAVAPGPVGGENASAPAAQQIAAIGDSPGTVRAAAQGDAMAANPLPGATEYAPPVSPVAPRRPPDLRDRMAAAVEAAQRSADDLARRAAESEVQVQLAADPDEEVIRAMWRRVSRSNSDILHDRELAVQTTISGGTTFYRLRVGPFSGVSEARAVCQALKARGQDCIVARNG